MWADIVRVVWSNLLFFVSRALKSDAMLARAAAADPMNYRAAHRLSIRNIDHGPFLALAWRSRGQAVATAQSADPSAQFFRAVSAPSAGAKAQIGQDLFVLQALKGKRDGYFVEIGVGDGVNLSNSVLLERDYGWRGLLAEPNPEFHAPIRAHRKAVLDPRAVFSESGREVEFICETGAGELSGLVETIQRRGSTSAHEVIKVATVSLNDLLSEHNAPSIIDYMSVDTEGSEYEILKGLDFQRFRPLVLTVEHNFDAPRLGKIDALLTANGYTQVLKPFSQFDAWYVHKSVPA
jgi:FkbM family methyltransferase